MNSFRYVVSNLSEVGFPYQCIEKIYTCLFCVIIIITTIAITLFAL